MKENGTTTFGFTESYAHLLMDSEGFKVVSAVFSENLQSWKLKADFKADSDMKYNIAALYRT